MPPVRTLVASLVLATLSAGAQAAVDCKNAASTIDINACAAIEQKAVEAKLNQVYQDVLKTFGAKDDAAVRTKLVVAQRAWVAFRKADCDAVYEKWSDGTIRGVQFIGCMQQRAEQRIKALQDFGERP